MKRSYEKPVLVHVGSVKEVVKSMTSGGHFESGTYQPAQGDCN